MAARRSTRALVVIVTLAALVGAVPGASATDVATATAPSFEDVPSDSTFATSITWLAEAGVTRGCNPPTNDRFCPDDNVTRGQFAAFFDRALDLPDAPERFDDVTTSNVFAANIGALAASGITLGCNPPTNDRFCPDDLLTRAQMAAFLHRASDTPQWPDTAPPSDPPGAVVGTILAAGDIANCPDYTGADATAALLEDLVGIVAPLGDLVYDDGTAEEFADCYVPTWGRFLDRTRPALGNHDVRTDDAAPYFDLFGAAAGPEPKGYYSYELGDWLVIVLNSNCGLAGGCRTGDPQIIWLRETLAAAPTSNVVAYWHHPRWSTGSHGDQTFMDAAWRTLADGGADVVLSGHDHDYQRYTPLDASGSPDPDGMRQFVVGTGGTDLRGFRSDDLRVESRRSTDLGVLELTLESCGYTWRFHTVDNGIVDRGRTDGTC